MTSPENTRTDPAVAEVAIARIPAGQSIELFGAVGELLDSALGGALLVPGNGHDVAATIITRADQTQQQAAAAIRRATKAIGKAKRKQEPVAAEPELDEEDLLTIEQMRQSVTGMDFGLGGATTVATEMAQHLLAAFIPAFEETEGAVNYLSWDAVDLATGHRYSIIVVRPNGLTPQEARLKADKECERLRGLLAEHGIDAEAARG